MYDEFGNPIDTSPLFESATARMNKFRAERPGEAEILAELVTENIGSDDLVSQALAIEQLLQEVK